MLRSLFANYFKQNNQFMYSRSPTMGLKFVKQRGLPLIKAMGLIIKTISKPIGKLMAKHANEFPRIRDAFAEVAQIYHRLNVILGPGDIRWGNVQPLPHIQAVSLGCEMISETAVFSICFGFLWYEYEKSAQKDAAKQAAHRATILQLKEEIATLQARLDVIEAPKVELTPVSHFPPPPVPESRNRSAAPSSESASALSSSSLSRRILAKLSHPQPAL